MISVRSLQRSEGSGKESGNKKIFTLYLWCFFFTYNLLRLEITFLISSEFRI